MSQYILGSVEEEVSAAATKAGTDAAVSLVTTAISEGTKSASAGIKTVFSPKPAPKKKPPTRKPVTTVSTSYVAPAPEPQTNWLLLGGIGVAIVAGLKFAKVI
jgi:hypothetical protein